MSAGVLFNEGFRSRMTDTSESDDLVVQQIGAVSQIQLGEVFWDSRQGLSDVAMMLQKRVFTMRAEQDLRAALELIPELVVASVVVEQRGDRLYKRVSGSIGGSDLEATVALGTSYTESTGNGLITAFVPILRRS